MNTMTTTMMSDDDRRLTPAERRMRDDTAGLPKHVRRRIDAYRKAYGFRPLWGNLDQRKQTRRP
jgi:hypothetical protein